jgi:hypothetical protein
MSPFDIIFSLLMMVFQVWMLFDAIRREQWIWAIFIGLAVFIFKTIGLAAILYYFLVYRVHAGSGIGLPSIEIPMLNQRRRITELETQIKSLDKAHHHAELGDIYVQQEKFENASKAYRSAVERDGEDLDYLAGLGKSLVALNELNEGSECLSRVLTEEPDHDFGSTQMVYAECLGKMDRADDAILAWKRVLESHSYAEARVKLAELYVEKLQMPPAVALLQEVISDEVHAPSFQQNKERKWVKRASDLLDEIN